MCGVGTCGRPGHRLKYKPKQKAAKAATPQFLSHFTLARPRPPPPKYRLPLAPVGLLARALACSSPLPPACRVLRETVITVTLAVVCYSTAASRYDGRVVLVSLGVAEDPAPPPPPSPPPPSSKTPHRTPNTGAGGAARDFEIATECEEDEEVELLQAETNAEIQEASENNSLLHEGVGGEAEEADAVATTAAARPLTATRRADVYVARRVVARWRAFVAERKGVLLFRLLDRQRDLFFEVLQRLDPTARTMLSQVGRPWLAAVLASGLWRAGKTEGVPLKLEEFCGSIGQLAWARANGCPCVRRTCSFVAGVGHLAVLQWAREHGCQWSSSTCTAAARGGHLAVLVWARGQDCPWGTDACDEAAQAGHMEVMQWAREHSATWNENWVRRCAAKGGHEERLESWLAEHGVVYAPRAGLW